jgi:hypothetical protein
MDKTREVKTYVSAILIETLSGKGYNSVMAAERGYPMPLQQCYLTFHLTYTNHSPRILIVSLNEKKRTTISYVFSFIFSYHKKSPPPIIIRFFTKGGSAGF